MTTLLILLALLGQTCERNPDLDCNGKVDMADVAIMQRAMTPSPTPTPAPAARFTVSRWGSVPYSPEALRLYAMGAASVTFNGKAASRDGYKFTLAEPAGEYRAVIDGKPFVPTMLVRPWGETLTRSGTWSLLSGSVPIVTDKWITYAGGSCSKAAIPANARVRFQGVTFSQYRSVTADKSAWLWFDGCTISNDALPANHPMRWYTGCTIRDSGLGVGSAQMIVGCHVQAITNDLAQGCLLLAETTLLGQDPGPIPPGEHADVWQWWGSGFVDAIIYRVQAADLWCQGVMAKTGGAGFDGFAIVDSAFAFHVPTRRTDRRGASLLQSGGKRMFVERVNFGDKWTIANDPAIAAPIVIESAHVLDVQGTITIGAGVQLDRSDWNP